MRLLEFVIAVAGLVELARRVYRKGSRQLDDIEAELFVDVIRAVQADDRAAMVERMCHWRQAQLIAPSQRRSEYDLTHEAYHFGCCCPYSAMAAVLRGRPDPRPALLVSS